MQKYFYQLAALLFAALSFTACTAEEDPTESDTLEVNVSEIEAPKKVTAGVPVKLSVKMTSTLEKIDKIIIYKNGEIFFDYDGESPRDLVNTPGKLRSGDAIKEVVKNKQYEYTFNDILTLADVQNGVDMIYKFEIVGGGFKSPDAGSVFIIKKADVTPPPTTSLVMSVVKTVSLRNRETSTEMGLRYASNPSATSSKVAITATNLIVPAPAGIDATSFAAVKDAYEKGAGTKEVVLTADDAGKLYITKLANDNYTFVKIVSVAPGATNEGYGYNGKIDFEYRQTDIKK